MCRVPLAILLLLAAILPIDALVRIDELPQLASYADPQLKPQRHSLTRSFPYSVAQQEEGCSFNAGG